MSIFRDARNDLQWRAGQLSGRRPPLLRAMMWSMLLQWRAGQLSGRSWKLQSPPATSSRRLQWRAGQLSGRSRVLSTQPRRRDEPSMEGRTIVRPELFEHCGRSAVRRAFNGGPDNCPAGAGNSSRRQRRRRGAFNGGPDNCPAGVDISRPGRIRGLFLQWRAGQLSGRSRPVPSLWLTLGRVLCTFNGGPDNCPAGVDWFWDCPLDGGALQWRAGQLSGRS